MAPTQLAHAVEFHGSFLYWRATEPVDWTLNTNRLPADQFVAYETITYDAAPGFRVGVAHQGEWDTGLYYAHFHTGSAVSASGNLTPAFMGGKLALSDDWPFVLSYFNEGHVEATIDYNVIDWDFGKSFNSCRSLRLRPVIGLKAAWINQTFDSGFQGEWPGGVMSKSITEHMENNFWGIGPKIGIENAWNAWRSEKCEINYTANFYTAYLLGHWTISDVSHMTLTVPPDTFKSTRVVPIDARDFGAVTFQAVIGIEMKYRRWTVTAGYEINDWLNQCQIFDDATGPHNNDLILQGLTASLRYGF